MPQIRVKVDGKFDESFSSQERAVLSAAVNETMRSVVAPARQFTDEEKRNAAKYLRATLEGYLTVLNAKIEEDCKSSGKECRLDSLRMKDLEQQAAAKELHRLEENKILPSFLELAKFVIDTYQEITHHKNTERIALERRSEHPYDGMYG